LGSINLRGSADKFSIQAWVTVLAFPITCDVGDFLNPERSEGSLFQRRSSDDGSPRLWWSVFWSSLHRGLAFSITCDVGFSALQLPNFGNSGDFGNL